MVEIKVGQVYEDLDIDGSHITIIGLEDGARYPGSIPIVRHIRGNDFPGSTNVHALARHYKLLREEV